MAIDDYIDIDRTEEQLTHAIDYADGMTKTEVEHAVAVTKNITNTEVEHAVAVTENMDNGNSELSYNETTIVNANGKIPFNSVENLKTTVGGISVGNNVINSGTSSIVVGNTAQADDYGVAIGVVAKTYDDYGTAVGYLTDAEGKQSVAIGYHADAAADGSGQIGYGANGIANSLQFRSTQIVNGDGKISFHNLSAIKNNGGLQFSQFNPTNAVGSYAIAIGNGSIVDPLNITTEARGSHSIAIGTNAKASAENSVQIGAGENAVANTLKFRNTLLVNANGKIPSSSIEGGGGGGGTTDYEDLENKPSINNVELSGNLSLSDLNIPTYTAGQNISISAENVISAGIEVIEI